MDIFLWGAEETHFVVTIFSNLKQKIPLNCLQLLSILLFLYELFTSREAAWSWETVEPGCCC